MAELIRLSLWCALAALAVSFALRNDVAHTGRFLRATVRLLTRRVAARRLRRLRRERLVSPWDGAIVRHRKFYTPSWNRTIGRAYRAWALERRSP